MTGEPLRTVDAEALRAWCRRSADALAVSCAAIDALNVFPVADGDTGTNMLLTMKAACAGFESAPGPDMTAADAARAAAAGSLTGARGSSGVILSRFLHGLAAGLADGELGVGDGAALQVALSAAADAAYAAVSHPVEGTILSVARAAAKSARDADPSDLAAVVGAAAAGAREELARTTEQLAVLSAAGVVDAGGQGLVVVLEALADTVSGASAHPIATTITGLAMAQPPTLGVPSFAYEVQYLLDAPEGCVDALRDRLSHLGDSVAIVSDAGVHNVHVHVDDVGAAIEAGIDVGRPHQITVTRFADARSAPVAPAPDADTEPTRSSVRIVAVCAASALADLFRVAGAVVVEPSADSAAVAASLAAATSTASRSAAVLLPNSRDYVDAAHEAAAIARAAGCAVTVVPTRSPVQGLAALAVHDPRRRVDDDAVAMSAAAAATRFAAVTKATYDALTSAGPCRSGDVLGLIDDDVVVIGDDVGTVARELVDRLLIGGGELVTVIAGSDAPARLATEIADYVEATRPAVEAVVHDGGQPTFPILLGVE